MSAPERPRKIVLSPRARQDFVDILRHAGRTWGQGQLHIHRDRINDALQSAARSPAQGLVMQALPDTHRACLVGSHVVVYRDLDAVLAVIRILPQRMLPGDGP